MTGRPQRPGAYLAAMELGQLLQEQRKRKGMTQDELAEQSGVTVRTIQRIESGETVPRAYTLKSLAAALGLPPEALQPVASLPDGPDHSAPAAAPEADPDEQLHFLRMLCLSCFSFILIPWVHFLLPSQMLRKRPDLALPAKRFGRKLIRGQVYWVLALQALLLAAVAVNYGAGGRGGKAIIPYLPVVFAMYGLNAVLILRAFFGAKRV